MDGPEQFGDMDHEIQMDVQFDPSVLLIIYTHTHTHRYRDMPSYLSTKNFIPVIVYNTTNRYLLLNYSTD